MNEPSFERPTDPLYRHTPQPFRIELPVLGIPVRFASNSADVLAVIESAFGVWTQLDGDSIAEQPPVSVRILVHERAEPAGTQADFVYRLPDDERTIIHTPGSVAVADPVRRDAVAYISMALLADVAHFRHGLVEALTLTLLTRYDRQPLHAAALIRDESALLLCGPSGAGKSTLLYAAARSGMQPLTDDAVFVQMENGTRIWAAPGAAYLSADVLPHFPELAGLAIDVQANGKQKASVDLRTMGGVPRALAASQCAVCVVGTRADRPALTRLTQQEAVAGMLADTATGFDIFAESIAPALRDLTSGGAWLLRPSHDPAASVPLLNDMLDRLAAEARCEV